MLPLFALFSSQIAVSSTGHWPLASALAFFNNRFACIDRRESHVTALQGTWRFACSLATTRSSSNCPNLLQIFIFRPKTAQKRLKSAKNGQKWPILDLFSAFLKKISKKPCTRFAIFSAKRPHLSRKREYFRFFIKYFSFIYVAPSTLTQPNPSTLTPTQINIYSAIFSLISILLLVIAIVLV